MSACASTGCGPEATGILAIPQVREVVCIASGKGGVGKSTLTVNLAAALAAQGVSVGIVDADIHGPSISLLLGTGDGVESSAEGLAIPKFSHGIWSLSVGNLLPPEAGLAWKGPLVTQAVEQLFREVAWPPLDVLLVDMPPGTGDVQITILERMPVTGAVVVSTPQRLAVVDAERGIALFHEYDIPVFGLVENMAGHICPCCGEITPLFEGGHVQSLAKRRHVAYLGAIPLAPEAAAAAESGNPLRTQVPDSAAVAAIDAVSARVRDALTKERMAREREAALSAEQRRDAAEFWQNLAD